MREDILFVLTCLGFENYREALKTYLARVREAKINEGGAPSYSSAASACS